KHRGGTPIHRSIIEGDEKTGVSIMYMAKTLDSGDIIAQKEIPILDEDSVGTIQEKLRYFSRELLQQVITNILKGTNNRTQQKHEEATFSTNILKSNEYIDFNIKAKEVFNQIRELNPFPGGYTLVEGKRLKLYASKITNEHTTAPP